MKLRILPALFSLLCISPLAQAADSSLIRLATTTSTDNSGLLNKLLPVFSAETGYKVHVIAVGTGKALRLGKDGDVDVVLVHARAAEDKFVEEGSGVKRYPVMYNDFVIVGPKSDPAKIAGVKTSKQVFSRIQNSKSLFISRGDNSGTHKKELSIWKAAALEAKGEWYREVGQGMGKVLQMANELDAYTLTDRGTWLAYQNKVELQIVFEGESTLFNPYGIIAVNPARYPDINFAGATALIEWITSKTKGQQMIGDFKLAGQQLFTPNAD
ncbi:MAG: substrate-binding domain-containing protein [Gammaproteobacteria bacterium]|nr:substrate-binding domain-containing protein [Gammaproteobacteria bacterium]MBL7000016.1 substrate-binding domain-containing protein [Gammaproteobacteria bacterium]